MESGSKGPGSLFNRNLVSIKQLDKGVIEEILAESERMLEIYKSNSRPNLLAGRIMASMFFEPSTRTRLSFESAMHRLGGSVIGFADPLSTSSAKGETLSDTVRIMSAYADILVIRHPTEGAITGALDSASVPLVNAGDGTGQHPTQALYDLFAIKKEKGRLTNLNVALVGDLKHGRAIHSLAYALAIFGNSLTLISPQSLKMPASMVADLERSYGIRIIQHDSLDQALNADAVYIPRMQKERFSDQKEYERVAAYYVIDKRFMAMAGSDTIILSPLPRTMEINPEVDTMKNAAYFRQAAYGVPVRMAVLKMILKGR